MTRPSRAAFDVPPGCPAVLAATRAGGMDAGRFVAPDPVERGAVRDAIAHLVGDGEAGRRAAHASALGAGYEIVDPLDLPGAVLLREVASRRRGGGAYVVALAPRAPHLFVQAPHTFYDAGTFPLACALFATSGAAALFIDTSHRYRSAARDATGAHPADNAHNAASLFQAATEGLLRGRRGATVVQLHGFSERQGGASLILSSGGGGPGDETVAQAAAAMAPIVGSGVRRYPEDTRDLGAVTNVQGIAVRRAGGRFLHVELDADLRRALLADAALRGRMLGALATVLGAERAPAPSER